MTETDNTDTNTTRRTAAYWRLLVGLVATLGLLTAAVPAGAEQSVKYVTNHAYVHTSESSGTITKGVIAEWWVMVKEPIDEEKNACNGLDDSVDCVYFPMMNIHMDSPVSTAIHIGPQLANNGSADHFGTKWIVNYGYYINGQGRKRQWTTGDVPVDKWIRFRMVKQDETYYAGEGWESNWRVTMKYDGSVTKLGEVDLPGRYFTSLVASYETIEFDFNACLSAAPVVRYRIPRYKVNTTSGTEWRKVYGVKAGYSGVDNDDHPCWRDEWRLTGKKKGKFDMIRYDSDPARSIGHGDWIWKCGGTNAPSCA